MRFKLKVIVTLLMLVFLNNVHAQSAEDLLKEIAKNTLDAVRILKGEIQETLITQINESLGLLAQVDDDENTKIIRKGKDGSGGLNGLNTLMIRNLDYQNDAGLINSLNTDLLGSTTKNIYEINGRGYSSNALPKPEELPYANDLTYSTLLGKPPFASDPRGTSDKGIKPQYNYIKNASGLNIFHQMPGAWMQGGTQDARDRYQAYYNTIMAAESFGANVLIQQYADSNSFNDLQLQLIKDASSEDMSVKIASEPIGVVLRQLLLYQSQIFLLMTQSVQLQKQAVAAQVMTNSIMIANNVLNEANLRSNAEGVQLQL